MKNQEFKNFQVSRVKLELPLGEMSPYWENLQSHPTKANHYQIKHEFDLHAQYASIFYSGNTRKIIFDIDLPRFLFDDDFQEVAKEELFDIELAMQEYFGISLAQSKVTQLSVSIYQLTNDDSRFHMQQQEDRRLSRSLLKNGIEVDCCEVANLTDSRFNRVLKHSLHIYYPQHFYNRQLFYEDLLTKNHLKELKTPLLQSLDRQLTIKKSENNSH